MTKLCVGCKQPIHPKRLEILPSATRCVTCSTAVKKAGVTVTKGTGDHTYTETFIMEHDEFVKYKEAAKLNKTIFDEIMSEDEYVLPPEEQDENHDALDFTNIGED